MIRLGLCCIFRNQPVRFRQTTATQLVKVARKQQLAKPSQICLENLENISIALQWLKKNDLFSFRILSPLFPRMTHPDVGYTIADLPDQDFIIDKCDKINTFRKSNNIRLSLHPDQFNVLSSPHQNVSENTVRELEYQGMLAELIGAEVINIHGGGTYGNKKTAIERLKSNFSLLSSRVATKLSLENDDRSYSPEDLLPVCRSLDIPFVYDVHHHRCLADGMTIEEATTACCESWTKHNAEPYFHISSPRNGWQSSKPQPHADYINPADFPQCWQDLTATIDVEAKAKELAVLQLKSDLEKMSVTVKMDCF